MTTGDVMTPEEIGKQVAEIVRLHFYQDDDCVPNFLPSLRLNDVMAVIAQLRDAKWTVEIVFHPEVEVGWLGKKDEAFVEVNLSTLSGRQRYTGIGSDMGSAVCQAVLQMQPLDGSRQATS